MEDLVRPLWTLKKFIVLNEIDSEMTKRDTYQRKHVDKVV